MHDFAIMQICHGLGAAARCLCADFDGDRLIDLDDLSLFADLLDGPD
jgi:hypothetical protein